LTNTFWLSAKSSPSVIAGLTLGGFALYAAAAVTEWTKALILICLICLYFVVTRFLGQQSALSFLSKVFQITCLASIAIVGGAFGLGQLFGDPIQSNGDQVVKLVLLMSACGAICTLPWYLSMTIVDDVVRSPGGKWLAWHVRSPQHKSLVGDVVAGLCFVALAYDVGLTSPV